VTLLPRTGRLLALDWGEIRIGLAASDETQLLASPLDTLTRRAGKRIPMPALLELVTSQDIVGLLVGLPLTPAGAEEEAAREARAMGELVASRTGLPMEYWDERMTTARALRSIQEQGGSTRGRKEDVDALAAAVLLQGYLDARRTR
jgi:putative Holliday junction resolvase